MNRKASEIGKRMWLWLWQKYSTVIVVALFIATFVAGYSLRGGGDNAIMSGATPQPSAHNHGSESQVWTCSMHPQIRNPKPGKCPICGMNLILANDSESQSMTGLRQMTVTPEAVKLMEVETSPVERRYVEAVIRMVGKVEYDETRLGYITAWVGGRLDRLFVDYTGVTVKEGDHMVELYSPELLSAQEELIQVVRAVKELENSGVGIIRETAAATVIASREKLRLWGLTRQQIKQIEERGTSSDHVTIQSPMSGIVIHKNAQEGMYVQTGTRIYTIADLTRLWVMFDAYESDLAWLHYGQSVQFTTEAYPGEVFTGTISFINPVLDDKRRTVKVRVNVSNEHGRLKPGMFIRGTVRAQVASGGRVIDTNLAGKWIGPMHPEIIKDEPGACDICGMPLVRAEELGYVSLPEQESAQPLVVPASAVLATGTRAIVYVKVPGTDKPTFEGREIVLGPRAGDYYIVRSNLEEGDLVVTHGNFKIDSALQLSAKPSMMNPESGGEAETHQHGGIKKTIQNNKATGSTTMPAMAVPEAHVLATVIKVPDEFSSQVGRLVKAYFEVASSLSDDDFARAQAGLERFQLALNAINPKPLDGPVSSLWMKFNTSLQKSMIVMRNAQRIDSFREGFALLSEELSMVARTITPQAAPLYRIKCPMAFNGRGATWLQSSTKIINPYFGSTMLRCGLVVETLSGQEISTSHGGHDHE